MLHVGLTHKINKIWGGKKCVGVFKKKSLSVCSNLIDILRQEVKNDFQKLIHALSTLV